jgi:hypothetical protein
MQGIEISPRDYGTAMIGARGLQFPSGITWSVQQFRRHLQSVKQACGHVNCKMENREYLHVKANGRKLEDKPCRFTLQIKQTYQLLPHRLHW